MLKALAATAIVALSLFGYSTPGKAEEAKVVKIGYILASDSQLGAGAAVFAAEVEKRTQGRYKVMQYPDAQLGGEVEMIKGVQLGTIDMAFVTGAPVPNFVPEVGIFGIPFLIRDARHAHAVLDGPFGQHLLDEFRAKNMIALAWGENGMRHLTNSKRPIATPADLKGLKLRVPQNATMVAGFDALGADTSQLAFPDLYGALQTGRFDGQENPIATIIASKFYQVQTYLTMSGHIYDPAVFLMSTDLWDDLSPQDRIAFTQAAKIGGEASRKFAANAEATGVAFLEHAGMKVVPSIDKAKFVKAMSAAMPAFEKEFGAAEIAAVRGQGSASY
jgi:tripartite ATP-independent transporter DctP family solute receptor